MSNEIWLQRWEEKNTAWHEEDVNPFLETNFHLLNLKDNATIFIPLCGKTLDIGWLLSHGFSIVGCELSHVAITALFRELQVEPLVSQRGKFKVYSAENITIFEGDIFNLTKELVGDIDAIYDRAALVALPLELRSKYTTLLREISSNAKQLLVTVVYEQSLHNKTPYSISQSEVNLHYKDYYSIKKVVSINIEGGLKGKCEAKDEVWFLS